MKADEPSPSSDSPDAEGKSRRKEPNFETIGNFTRVTPAQSSYVVFPSSSRFRPVRPLSTRPPARNGKSLIGRSLGATEKYAGGGGIVMLIDTQPGAATEFVEVFVPPPPPSAAVAAVPNTSSSSSWNSPPVNVSLDENAPDAEPPQPFEVKRPVNSYIFTS